MDSTVQPLHPLCEADFDESSWEDTATDSILLNRAPSPTSTNWHDNDTLPQPDPPSSASWDNEATSEMDPLWQDEGQWTPRKLKISESSTPKTDEMMDVTVAPSIPEGLVRRMGRGWSTGSVSSSSVSAKSEERYKPFFFSAKPGILFPQNSFKNRRKDPLRPKKVSKKSTSSPLSNSPPSKSSRLGLIKALFIGCAFLALSWISLIKFGVCEMGSNAVMNVFSPFCVIKSLYRVEVEDEERDGRNPVAAIAVLVDSTDGHMIDIIQDLMSFPPSLNISLSAHAARSLAGTVRANIGAAYESKPTPTTTDVGGYRHVADTLEDLATSLNEVSDAVLTLTTSGHTATAISSTRLHWVRDRSDRAQAVWRQAEAATWEAVRTLRDIHAHDPWRWFRSDVESAKVVTNLADVVGELKGLAPCLVKLDGDVKRLRSDVQGLRGGIGTVEAVEASLMMKEEGWTGFLWEKLKRVEEGVEMMRGQAPLIVQRRMVKGSEEE
ncbi:hypothetical protein BC829DRAFT_384755 [Chytridium lagenaria]|nr:hypothetical protein BC829DRAFT_384755 [Chytridium lagenaria]